MIEMEFQRLAKSIVDDILGANEEGRFRTVGFQRQDTSAEENLDNDRSIQVFYSAGSFPKSASRYTGPVQHDMTFKLEFTVAVASKGDVATVVDEASTTDEVIAAIRTFQNASAEADKLMDELFAIVYQILMDGNNEDMGRPQYTVANRWVDDFQKNDPIEQGEYSILTAAAFLKCRVSEELTGDEGVAATEGVDVDLNINEDTTAETAVKVQ